MKADYLTYRRAAGMSLVGILVQLALGLGFLFYSIFQTPTDHAALTAACFMLMGVPVWLVLAIVFDQHRRERIEAIEAEAFSASGAQASSVFDANPDELRLAEKRLRWMYKWLIPAASIVIGAALITIGLFRYDISNAFAGLIEQGRSPLPAVENRGWPMGLGLGAAFVAFVFARYAAVASRQKAWGLLRAGAGFAVGTSLLGLIIALGHLIDIAGPDWLLRFIILAFPAVLVLLGAEVFLNFVLDIYRPRKAGEYPRPAFESRILGFVAAPDRLAESIGEAINYQFGYDVASSWFYRLFSRVFLRYLVPVGLLVMWGLSALSVIRPHQQGIVTRFGAFHRVVEPGLNLKWPWPIESVEIPEYVVRDVDGKVTFRSDTVTGIRTLRIGSQPKPGDEAILWTNEHAMEEVFFLVQPILSSAQQRGMDTAAAGGGSASVARNDLGLAMVAVEFPLHYAIDDVEAYERLGPPGMRDELLQASARRELMQVLSSRSVGELLSDKRLAISGEIRQRIIEAFVRLNPKANGKPVVRLVFGEIGGIHPPRDAATAYEGVVGAEQKFAARLKKAESTAIQALTKSVGDVERARELARLIEELGTLARDKGAASPEHAAKAAQIREKLAQAGGNVASLLSQASSERWERHMGERARLAAYQGMLETYRAAPAVFRASLYFDAIRQALANQRVVIVSKDINLEVQYDSQDKDLISNIFETQQSP